MMTSRRRPAEPGRAEEAVPGNLPASPEAARAAIKSILRPVKTLIYFE